MKKEINLLKNEIIDDLEFKNLKIIQNTDGFKFGIDSILLSDFASKNIKKNDIICDFGTGSGIIGILLCGKTSLKKIYGIEIQEEVSKMAVKSVLLNHLQDKFEIINDNIKNLKNHSSLKPNSFDLIVSNPPYKKLGTGIINSNNKKQISRHEISASFEDFVIEAKRLLKSKGSFIFIHQTDRLTELISILKKYSFEAKEIRFIHPKANENSNLVLIKAVKGASSSLKVFKPLYVYTNDGSYTKEIYKIYSKKEN